jgi:hypothetical protein
MDPILTGLLCAVITFAGGLVGLGLQRLLPSHHLGKEMQDLVKLSAGMIGTLTALVLGLLVSSAKSSFDTINTSLVQGGAKIITFDRTLARYGPETAPVRELLKQSVTAGLDTVWPSERKPGTGFSAFEGASGFEVVQDRLATLQPVTELQRLAFNQANQLAGDLSQSRWLLVEQTHSQLPTSLLAILVFWLFLLFISYGLFAPWNRTALVVLAVGACAVSAAVFLVLELNRPFEA